MKTICEPTNHSRTWTNTCNTNGTEHKIGTKHCWIVWPAKSVGTRLSSTIGMRPYTTLFPKITNRAHAKYKFANLHLTSPKKIVVVYDTGKSKLLIKKNKTRNSGSGRGNPHFFIDRIQQINIQCFHWYYFDGLYSIFHKMHAASKIALVFAVLEKISKSVHPGAIMAIRRWAQPF